MTDLLVDAAWLASHRDGVVVADVRWSATGGTAEAERAFEAGHIAGAVFFDVDRDLAGAPFVEGPGRHPLPRAERFAETLASRGIGPHDRVVIYDDAGGSVAARLWWMPDALGRDCALLDGGLAAWPDALETGPTAPRARADVEIRPWPKDRLVEADGVARAVQHGDVVIDARGAERYPGETEPIDPVAGHIPGARSGPFPDVGRDDGAFPSPDTSRARDRRRSPMSSEMTVVSDRPSGSVNGSRTSASPAPRRSRIAAAASRPRSTCSPCGWRGSATHGSTKARGRIGCTIGRGPLRPAPSPRPCPRARPSSRTRPR